MSLATPFSKLLVANRGEIAVRVMRSARALGLRTVAVYSTADARAPHVVAADQAVCIGEPQPAQSYLRIDALIDAARRSGADAIHPGYGFLAENADFAEACRQAGLVFVGPSPEAVRAMGDKANAKRLMIAAGVPCIPGYQGPRQDERGLAEEGARLGYPLMIKATAGGGGRGMRRVVSPAEFAELLRSAQSEAAHAFGDPTVILERAVLRPRHVEVQVFADRHGNVVHLGERDCSVQRRHQKLIEEAPSPAVNPELRERMGAAAVAAARAVGYEGAGTLEFLLDPEGGYYFMEMNTRLQVEHPVTEEITGLDLVEWQLRIAAGEPLPLRQEQIGLRGHAIEVRLCAEDVPAGFMPQSGVLSLWQPPAGRVEHALCSGAEVAPYYDSMIAKLVAHGASREEARRKLLLGVEDMVALGVRTNQQFLARCLAHPEFADGKATTDFIGEHEKTLVAVDEAAMQRAALVGAWLLHQTEAGPPHPGQALSHALTLTLGFELDGQRWSVGIAQQGPQVFALTTGDRTHRLEAVTWSGCEARFILDGLMNSVHFVRDGASLWLHCGGSPHQIEDHTRAAASRQDAGGGDGRLRASMNGRVVALLAAVGDAVTAGQPLLTLEAMKMEHVHPAPVAGRLAALHVAVGEQVHAQRILAEIVPSGAAEAAP